MRAPRKRGRMSQGAKHAARGTEAALSCYRVAMMPDRRRCHPKPERTTEKSGPWRCGTSDRGESNLKRDHRLLAISSRRDTWCLRLCSCSFPRSLLLSISPRQGHAARSRIRRSQLKNRSSFSFLLSEPRRLSPR